MDVFFLILIEVILPVFILIGAGAFLHRKFTFDLNTLSKLTTYFLIPAISFVNIYESNIGGETMLITVGLLTLHNVCLILLCSAAAKAAKFDASMSSTFKNSVVLINAGNFGLPVSQLIFQTNPLGASIQVIVLLFQNFLNYTYGLMNCISAKSTATASMLKELVKNPIIFTSILGLILNIMAVDIPSVIWGPVENTANAFIAIALVTLGAQSAYLKLNRITLPLVLSLAGRLIISPIIALIFLWMFGISGTVAQALFIASSFPSSRNSALFALEYHHYPDLAAQIVLVSTLLSSITVTIVVYLSKVLF
ncbi:AEC family transporter [Bacillus litorisediminis]|uniref:AEC family transporter n=1 Tax=Bacillus litorisediminis TaxID=2922713 RepID=UPI001FB020AD|nr:AEC family transporter [Bacillus litorisediminis]